VKTFAIVAAVDDAGGLGRDGDLVWHLPGDLRYFREVTSRTNGALTRNAVVMGRLTWESIPERFRPLADRLNVVITRQPDYGLPGDALRAGSLEQALDLVNALEDVESVFVVGGGQIYREAIRHPGCGQVLLTHVQGTFDCDVFFPDLPEEFTQQSLSPVETGDAHPYRYARYSR
jgi:dihydrofolate reductase